MTEHCLRRYTDQVLLAAVLMLSGCSTGQQFRALSPDQFPILFATNQHVLEVSTTPLVQRADYSLRENLTMLAPRAARWKTDLEWRVKRVLKGDAPERTMMVLDLPFPSEEATKLGFSEWTWHTNPFTSNLVLWIGFDSYDRFHFEHLTLLKPTEDQTQLPAQAFIEQPASTFRNRSIASINGLSLEVEQPLYEWRIHIRIRDGTWNENRSCDVYYVNEAGVEFKLATVRMRSLAPSSNEYYGTFSDGKELPHGTTLKIDYKSNALRLPISTWITMIYH